MLKKNGSLRFIQDMQPMNVVSIKNVGVGPIVDEYVEAFAGRTIYSMDDLYSGYDQFQLVEASRDLKMMKMPLGLVRMCTLLQCATNSVAHMMHGMNIVLRDFVLNKTMSFLDDVPIKGCNEQDKDKTLDQKECRQYVVEHIEDCEGILARLEEGCASFITFKFRTMHMLRSYCIDCVDKNQMFRWEEEHVEAMQKLKDQLSSSPFLGRIDYKCGRPMMLTIDTSPIAIGWAVGQDDAQGSRFTVGFGVMVLSIRQRAYLQVKRKLWGVVTTMKVKKEHLIDARVVIETNCLPLLGMITN
ncbi:hypothetical protein R1flu_027005 [Riccia fluitans]|uniref:Reverse transcriptase/retrotransposon-derived protein RNase H-like domain-containing protein n=1 Tax=Riccia fluitans TaxID=41844 RepID=A0ABD1XHL4_9MARC